MTHAVGHQGAVSPYPGRPLVVAGYVVWLGCVLYVAACLVAPALAGSTSCELGAGSSVFGQPSRSWVPPGTTCTYDLQGHGELVLGPSPVRLVVVALALAGLPLLVYLGRLLRGLAGR